MKYYFLINPAAGKKTDVEALKKEIENAASDTGSEAVIYVTKSIGDAERFVRSTLEADPEEELCFVACGGDGTFNEVLNGCMGSSNAICSVYPIGTGNDFVRNFHDNIDFHDIRSLFRGEVIRCDTIEYSGVIDGEFQVRYCGNMFNIGFDCNVVDKTAELKTKPLLSGSLAYLAGVASTLIKKKGADLRVEADGQVLCDGPILLTSIANGSYCGGGVMSNPYAELQDGMIDISVIRDLGRLRFISLFPKYQKGTHLELDSVKDIITNLKVQEVMITPRNGSMRLCVDGEIYSTGGVLMRIQPEAFRLLVPEKKHP